jgi:hypothetical protein
MPQILFKINIVSLDGKAKIYIRSHPRDRSAVDQDDCQVARSTSTHKATFLDVDADLGLRVPASEYLGEMLDSGEIIGEQDPVVGVEKYSRNGVRRSIQSAYEPVDGDVEEDRRDGRVLQNAASTDVWWRRLAIHEHPPLHTLESQAADDEVAHVLHALLVSTRILHHIVRRLYVSLLKPDSQTSKRWRRVPVKDVRSC